MTRLHVLSDLHREFGPFSPEPVDADVVVLAGDIDVGIAGLTWARRAFPHHPIVYVAGNHEYYGAVIPPLTDDLREAARRLDVAFLEDETRLVAGVRFAGCTLWTDLGLYGLGSTAADAVLGAMADYRCIRVAPEARLLRPTETAEWHRRSVAWLAGLGPVEGVPTVIVTHHAPSPRSVAPRHQGDPVSAGFASDLEATILRLGVPLWIHGHTHHSVDYRVGSTRVLSNQRGYPGEPGTGFVPDRVAEIA